MAPEARVFNLVEVVLTELDKGGKIAFAEGLPYVVADDMAGEEIVRRGLRGLEEAAHEPDGLRPDQHTRAGAARDRRASWPYSTEVTS